MTIPNEPRLGTTLFSLTLEWLSGHSTLDTLLAEVARRGLGPGVELVGFQSLRDFPNVTDAFAERFRLTLAEHGLHGTALGAELDFGIHRGRLLDEDETTAYLQAQLDAAARLGFPLLRVPLNTPLAVIRRLVPVAEANGVILGVELHSPHPLDHPSVMPVRDLVEETDSTHLGFIADFGSTMHSLPTGWRERLLLEGLDVPQADFLETLWAADLPVEAKFRELHTSAVQGGLTPHQRTWMTMTLSVFGRQPPEQWHSVLHRVVHVHTKFFGFDAAGLEASIDYPALISILRRGNYNGTISSEWGGHLYTDEVSGFDAVEQQHALLRKLWAAPLDASPRIQPPVRVGQEA